MVKIIKNFLFTSFILLNFTVFGANEAKNASYEDSNYEDDYYEDEGRLVFKLRVHGVLANAKQSGLPAAKVANPSKVGNFVENGFGVDVSTVVFFSDNIASELSLGFSVLKTKYASIKAVGNNYGVNSDIGKKKDTYMIPLTLTGQYHIAPFGAIRPYVGAGYHGAYMFSKSKLFNINNGHGPVLQAGVDFVAKDDIMINFDIKQYFLNTKVNYKESYIKPKVTSKIKINPLLISLGIGYKF